jgi:hypothetical protein
MVRLFRRLQILATISPAESSFSETISTLRFLERAKRVTLQAQRNETFVNDNAEAAAARSQIRDLESKIAILRKEMAAMQTQNSQLLDSLHRKSTSPFLAPIVNDTPADNRKDIDTLKGELGAARDQLSIKTVELECLLESQETRRKEFVQTICELERKLKVVVQNEHDLIKEKNEQADYYSEMLLETTTVLENEREEVSSGNRDLIASVLDAICLRCELQTVRADSTRLAARCVILEEDNSAINSELFSEYESHEFDKQHSRKQLEEELSVAVERNSEVAENLALGIIHSNELRRGAQFLEFSKQVNEYKLKCDALAQQLTHERECHLIRQREFKNEVERAVRSISLVASGTYVNEGDNSKESFIEELQSEVILLNMKLVDLKACDTDPHSTASPTEASLPDSAFVSPAEQACSIVGSQAAITLLGSPSTDSNQGDDLNDALSEGTQRTFGEKCVTSLDCYVGRIAQFIRVYEQRACNGIVESASEFKTLHCLLEECKSLLVSLSMELLRHKTLEEVKIETATLSDSLSARVEMLPTVDSSELSMRDGRFRAFSTVSSAGATPKPSPHSTDRSPRSKRLLFADIVEHENRNQQLASPARVRDDALRVVVSTPSPIPPSSSAQLSSNGRLSSATPRPESARRSGWFEHGPQSISKVSACDSTQAFNDLLF